MRKFAGWVQRGVVAGGVLASLGWWPGQPRAAQAATFTVNRTTDQPDAGAARDGVCAITGGGCTLRAAIQEANATSGASIAFNIPIAQGTDIDSGLSGGDA